VPLTDHGCKVNSEFSYPGDYTIDDNDTSGDIAVLSGYTGVAGTLFIQNTTLTSLSGLDNLNSIGRGLSIWSNIALTSLNGLENLTYVNTLGIYDNDALTNLSGLENLTSVGGFLGLEDNVNWEEILFLLWVVCDESIFQGIISYESQ